MIDKLNMIKSKKIHPVYQTKNDLIVNIKKQDKIIVDLIKNGIILWGKEVLLEAIKNGAS
jgi:hypothetical protein